MKEEADKEKEPSPLRDVLIHERHELQKWKETVEIRPPNLLVPRQIASHIDAQPLCKLAVSPKGDYIALMSHRRTFQIFRLTEDGIEPESSVQILEDASAEYCIFEFSASGTLLLSTRSDASIDVFDRLAEHCYTVMPALPESSPDLVSAISSLSSYSLMATEEKFTDYMAALHYNCTLSAYKMGRTSYFKLFTVVLESPLVGACRLLPAHGMLLATTHYRIGADDEIPGGLASYRLVKGTPHVVPVVVPKYETNWLDSLTIRLPFASSYAYIASLSVDAAESRAVGVSTTGDIFLYSLPSLALLASLAHVTPRLARPLAAVYVHAEELGVLFSSGRLIRCPAAEGDRLMQLIAEGDQHSSECYSARTQLVVPAERELFVLQSEGGPEVTISSQPSLFARLWTLTLWRYFKTMMDMMVGAAATTPQQATQLLSLEFTLWHAPIVTLEEVLERTLRRGDFARAIQLADQHPEIEKDSVYKRQWMEVCGSGRLTEADVTNILGRVVDVRWKAERCLQTATPNMGVQRRLVEEGISLGAPLALHVRLAHHGRVLAVMEEVEMYLEMREWPLLKVAEGLAERGSLVALERLLLSNWAYSDVSSSSSSSSPSVPLLSAHALSILSRLPSSIEPKRYEALVPNSSGQLVVEQKVNKYAAELRKVRGASKEGEKEVDRVDVGEEDEKEEEKDMEKWAEARARTIEAETGIVPYAIQLLELVKKRGCESVDDSLTRWKHLDLFIRITRSVSASLDFLQSAPVSLLGQHFNVLDDSSLISSLPSIIDLLEWHSPGEFEAVLRSIVTARTTTSIRLLHALLRERPTMVDGELMVEALSSLTLTGADLLAELDKLMDALEEEQRSERAEVGRVSRALATLDEKNVHPTFGKLIASQTDALRAREVLAQLVHIRRGERRDEEGWRRVARDVLTLNRLIYKDLLSEEEAMEMVAERFLLDADLSGEEGGGGGIPVSTLLIVGGEEEEGAQGPRLSRARSTELLLRLADSFIASSVDGRDEQLQRARMLAREAARGDPPADAKGGKKPAETPSAALLRSLEIIERASELGSGRLPIQIKHADPQTLLDECIAIGDNYKIGKRCARLAQLLQVPTPVASAFAACALHAVERRDEATLAQYIQEISKARNLPVVHTLCMRLLETPLLPQFRPTIESCAIANATEEELEEVLLKICSLRMEMDEVEEREEGERRGGSEERRSEKEEEEKRDTVPLDPYYTRAEQQESASCWFGDWRMAEEERQERIRRIERCSLSSPSDALSLLAAESASAFAAAAMLSGAKEAEERIADERLRRYASALRQLLPRLNGCVVQRVPPRKMIQRAIVANDASTALDRLEAHGSSRERFVENGKYRLDTIEGLASMEDASSWSDALELAAQFGIAPAIVHLASLENCLTTLPPASARALIALRGHSQALAKDDETIRMAGQKLRKAVLPLVHEDEQYLLYLEQFHSTATEATLLHLVQYLSHHCGAKDLKSLFFDESRLARAIERVRAEDAERVGEWLKLIPGTSSACEEAARAMMGERADPRKFLPLIRDPSMLIELLGDASVDLEADIDWLLQYPALPAETQTALRRHRQEMFGGGSARVSEERREESPIGGGGWREESPEMGGGGGMLMRRRGQ